MPINPLIIGPIAELGKSLIDRIFPDKIAQAQERAKAELELAALTQSHEIKETEVQLSAIIAEAQSPDPWTSRARPSFLYVMYTMILASIPMGVLFSVHPDVASSVTTGVKLWLEAIPEEMWWLFGAVYLGYTGARTIDKSQKQSQKQRGL